MPYSVPLEGSPGPLITYHKPNLTPEGNQFSAVWRYRARDQGHPMLIEERTGQTEPPWELRPLSPRFIH